MEKLNSLYQWFQDEGIFLFDRQLPFSGGAKAVTIHLGGQDAWGIFLDRGRLQTAAEEKSAALHEGGHYSTGTTHEVCSPLDLVAKHEYKADKWAVQRAMSAEELRQALDGGCTDLCALAEHFGITEELMKKAVCWYIHGNLDVEDYVAF